MINGPGWEWLTQKRLCGGLCTSEGALSQGPDPLPSPWLVDRDRTLKQVTSIPLEDSFNTKPGTLQQGVQPFDLTGFQMDGSCYFCSCR